MHGSVRMYVIYAGLRCGPVCRLLDYDAPGLIAGLMACAIVCQSVVIKCDGFVTYDELGHRLGSSRP